VVISEPLQSLNGQNITNKDFGYVPYYFIGDFVWYDDNGNGIQDVGESGVEGAVLELLTTTSTVPVDTQTTGPDGSYKFKVDSVTDYSVRLVLNQGDLVGYKPTITNAADSSLDSNGVLNGDYAVSVPTQATDYSIDFGVVPITISDIIYCDVGYNDVYNPAVDIPLTGITVQLIEANTGTLVDSVLSDQTGRYTFTKVDPDLSYYVRVPFTTSNLQKMDTSSGRCSMPPINRPPIDVQPTPANPPDPTTPPQYIQVPGSFFTSLSCCTSLPPTAY